MNASPPEARVAIVYHSGSGKTRILAERARDGALSNAGVECAIYTVEEALADLEGVSGADAIVLGSPTYMGSASAEFKRFMDGTARIWAFQGWKDKLAAGFTNSSAPSGDKLGTLMQLSVFAAQHGMVWVGLGLPPAYAATSGDSALNRLGSHLGAMAHSPVGRPAGEAPPEADRRSVEYLGKRVGELALRWMRGRTDAPRPAVHATAAHWAFPPERRSALPSGIRRTNLRELGARPSRFEHHLRVVARIGGAQLELAVASEPLYFAHANCSDEYSIALPSGDPIVDGFPLRTFVTDAANGQDVARYNHHAGDLVLHPEGWIHWPGRLRSGNETFDIPDGMRRTGLSMVFCATSPSSPMRRAERPLFVSNGRALDAKSYVAPPPPLMLADVFSEEGRTLATVSDATMTLAVRPTVLAPPRGAYVVILEASPESGHFPLDLLYLPEGAAISGDGILRALVVDSSTSAPEPAPALWDAEAQPPFAPFESVPRMPLPIDGVPFAVHDESPTHVRVRVQDTVKLVPRYWLARFLFRIALHDFRLGYVETYEGFFADDRGERVRIGFRDGAALELPRSEVLAWTERLYRAVAPDGYRERL